MTELGQGTDTRERLEDLVAGQAVLEAGRTLTPIEVGIAAALGHDSVRVGGRPRVGVLATGVATANCAWGDDGSTLYVCADKQLCRIKTKTKGKGF